jgi:hypothetical protein
VETVKQMILFMYTHTYDDSVQAGLDGTAVPEADSRQEAQLQIWPEPRCGLQSDVVQTASEITPETEEETDEMTRAKTLKSLLFHVKMNAIADYYDIPELRHRASTKIQTIFNTQWSPHDFRIVIREVFNSTGDKELHNILSEVMTAHLDELIGLGEDIAPPEVISDFANSVIRRLIATTKSLENRLVNKINGLASQLHEAEQQVRDERSTHEETSARMQRIDENTRIFMPSFSVIWSELALRLNLHMFSVAQDAIVDISLHSLR